MIRQITQEDLNKVLELHQKWWNSEEGGERANLSFTDLRGFNLRCANLVNADLSGANLSNVNLCGANLFEANLRKSDLSHAALYGTNLGYTNLSGADLSGANLGCANLSHANLDEKEQSRKGTILKEPIVGYKKCKDETIVTLEIPKGAIVFSINNNQCRTNKAKVIDISNKVGIAYSEYDENFTYELGKEIEIKDFDLQYNVEWGTGIHFFRTREEAEKY